MSYYILSINNDNNLWRKYSTISPFFYNKYGEEIESPQITQKEDLYYERISSGNNAPIEELDGFFLIDQKINDVLSLEKPGELELVPIKDLNNENPYWIFNIINKLDDSIDWDKSVFEPWPSSKKNIQAWEHVKGQVFYTPVVFESKIPKNFDIFIIHDWPDNNIVVSEKMKQQILELDFDKRFIIFTPLEFS